jgi:EAL domain-containing protein (putative c-di-GMP-specific phosphodiesterase class I)
MREALEHDELFLMYQPRLSVSTGRISGLEALLRWRHPEHGVLLPAAFLSEAEDNGIIVPIGKRVFDLACAFIHRLRQLGYTDLPVTVNASYREYSQPDFVSGIAERLRRYGLPPTSLEVELREEGLIRNPDLGREVAAQIHALGVPLSVDAFGDGVSHLAYLQELAATNVKMARQAVHAITGTEPGSAMAKTLIDIGRNLNIMVIGEAVETRAQMEFLTLNGCDQIQGAWFSAPLGADEVQQMLMAYQAA